MSRQFNRQFKGGLGVLKDPVVGIILDWGKTVPTNGAKGYCPGAIFIDVDAAGGSQVWINEGSKSSSLFVALSTDASGTFTTLTATTATITTLNSGTGGLTSTGRITTTDGVSGGTARVVGGLAYSNTAPSSAVGGTSAETAFDTAYTMPANTLKAGTVMKVRYQGIATTGVGSDTFAHKLYIGGISGTALISAGAAQLATNATFLGEFTLICRTAGATGTMVGYGTYKQSSAEGTMTVKDVKLASTTINTTANQAITVSGTWNTTNANSCRLDVLTVEIY